jgi:hypothetical protein
MPVSQVLLHSQVQELQAIDCFVDLVRVVLVKRGPQKEKVHLFYGKVRELHWDPGRLLWPKGKPFMEYTTQLGRKLLRDKRVIPDIPRLRWSDTLPSSFVFPWKANWAPERASKESGLIWQVWHKALAVNTWCAKITPQVDTDCFVCTSRLPENIPHRFWDCTQAQVAWQFTHVILKRMAHTGMALSRFNHQHALFGLPLPK